MCLSKSMADLEPAYQNFDIDAILKPHVYLQVSKLVFRGKNSALEWNSSISGEPL